ncbi:MAG: methyltransferase domain-containing protein [Candidatus Magasanikbacteria bacterium]|jgi:tRNA G10  N-methylase Trm11|nr:methyltransferase domain-containing protein [Candidatus Magasanikbacteria bacterium]
MHTYLFELGAHPLISEAEIRAALPNLTHTEIRGHFLIASLTEETNCAELMKRLGGTIRIAEKLSLSPSPLELSKHLDSLPITSKIVFSVSGDNAKRLGIETKKTLRNEGRSARYVEANNTATILHNKLVDTETDFIVIGKDVFVTRAIQPIEALSKRDFERPGRDAKSGMLPPKLAQMLITLSGVAPSAEKTLLDPYCGSGTVLMEALLMGYGTLIGTDISDRAVQDSQENVDWLSGQSEHQANVQIFKEDIEKLATRLDPESVDVVAFEPYMGVPLFGNEPAELIMGQAKNLSTLYVSAFKQLHLVMKPGAVCVAIIPQFMHEEKWVSLNCIPDILAIGFELSPLMGEHKSLLYHRDGQHVGRAIWRFVKR